MPGAALLDPRHTLPGADRSRKVIRRIGLISFAAAAVAAGAATIVGAQAAVPSIGIDPPYGPPFTILRISGEGFCNPSATCGPVSIAVDSVQVDSSHVTWGPGGSFTAFVQVPGSARPGADAVVAGQTIGGNPTTARNTFNVTTGVPAPTTYPVPSNLRPPGGFPTQTPAGPAGPSPQASASPPAQSPAGPSQQTTSSSRTTVAGAGLLNRNSSGGPPLGLWIAIAIVAAAAVAAAVWWLWARRAA